MLGPLIRILFAALVARAPRAFGVKYWTLDHVKGKPLIIAVADFHDDQSMVWSGTALLRYLYGVSHDFHHDDSGQLIISPLEIESHQVGSKEIPVSSFNRRPKTSVLCSFPPAAPFPSSTVSADRAAINTPT